MTVPGGSACNEHKVFFLVTLKKGLTPKGPNRLQHRPERVRGGGGLGPGPRGPGPGARPQAQGLRSHFGPAVHVSLSMYLSACIFVHVSVALRRERGAVELGMYRVW